MQTHYLTKVIAAVTYYVRLYIVYNVLIIKIILKILATRLFVKDLQF